MKYKAKRLKSGELEGKWAVFTGTKFFVDSLCDTENEAKIQACEYSAHWLQTQMDDCRANWEDAHRANGKVDNWDDNATKETMMDFDREWGNILC